MSQNDRSLVLSVAQAISEDNWVSAMSQLFNVEHTTVDLATRTANGETLLKQACVKGHEHLARQLLKMGAPIDDGGPGRSSPLAAACFSGNPDLVNLLLDAGALVNPPQDMANGSSLPSPLLWAASKGMTACLDRLVRQGAIVDLYWYACPGSHDTPLHGAVKNGKMETVTALLRHGASLDLPDGDGQTPRECARDPAIAQALLDHEQALLADLIATPGSPDGPVPGRRPRL